MSPRALAGTIAMAVACGALAQHAYRWIDENGRTHITDTPPPATAKGVQKKALISGGGSSPSAPVPAELEAPMRDSPVLVYSAPACEAACSEGRDLLNKRGVPFQEVYVWEQERALELKRLSGGVVIPTFLVGTSVAQGFDPARLNVLLDAARYPKTGVLPPRVQAAPPVPKEYMEWREEVRRNPGRTQ